MPPDQNEITNVLADLNEGDPSAWDRLMTLIYEELRRLAARHLAEEGHALTLQPTALAHEAYLRLVRDAYQDWRGRAHFFGAAANAIRRVLVDEARRRKAAKRGGDWARIQLDVAVDPGTPDDGSEHSPQGVLDIDALDAAMTRLGEDSPRQVRVVEMRFFGGMNVEDVAVVLGVSVETVKRDWRLARAWLKRELKGNA
jgi:RNA polymerase sigma factor (TIGR02999 family)